MTTLFTLAELQQERAEAEARMLDTFAISVPTGGWVYDDLAEQDVEELTPLFETPGYIPPAAGILSQSAEAGGRTVVTSRREIRIPWDSAEVPVNAVAVCTAIGPTTPPRMLNKRYRVGGSSGASQGTACHLEILEDLT